MVETSTLAKYDINVNFVNTDLYGAFEGNQGIGGKQLTG